MAEARARPADHLLAVPFRQMRNPAAPLELASGEQIERLHLASLRILEEIGIDFMDAEALAIWEKAGARVDHKAQHVWLDRGLVMDAVANAPASFTWRARNPAHNVHIGGNAIALAPQGGVAYVTSLERGRDRGTLKDYENLLKINQMSGVLHFAGEQLIAPHEVPASLRHLNRLPRAIRLTDKALMEAAHGREITGDAVAMARLVFGTDLGPDPVIGGVINANSPLKYDDRMLGGLVAFARAGQITIVTPFILAGAMSPISIASALAQQNAEALAGIALTQLVRPGAPVIYGGFTTNVDMKSGSPAFGTPEGAWAMSVGAQLARRYNLPYRGSGSLNTAKAVDAQAAYETAWTLWPAVMAHTNFIMHSVGWMEGGLTVSYEKIVIDLENLAMFQHFLAGFDLSDEAFDPRRLAAGGGGAFQPFLADRGSYRAFTALGGPDTATRATSVWKDLVARYEAPPLDPGIKDALDDFVARRERELEGKSLYD